jgi:hypothetical protein
VKSVHCTTALLGAPQLPTWVAADDDRAAPPSRGTWPRPGNVTVTRPDCAIPLVALKDTT